MLTIVQVANDLLSKLGIEGTTPSTAPALAQQDTAIAINAALQMLQAAGQDYFTRQHLTLFIGAGTAFYPIPQSVQAVLGPIRLNNQIPLKALTSRGQLDEFDRIFLGQSDYGAALGTPLAYWVEMLNNQASAGDIDSINIWLCPVPNAAGSIDVEVVDLPPAYAVADLVSTAYLPVAHEYTESIFLPIARMLMTRSSQFSRPELLSQLTDDAKIAMDRLGMKGGFPNAVQDGPAREVEA